jgi:hypothetical protein
VTVDARPVEVIGATDGAEDDHVTKLVIFAVSPLGQVPVATNCCRFPSAGDGFAGEMEIESKFDREPVPDRAVVWGLVPVLSVMLRSPDRVPRAVGRNNTEIKQLAPPAKVLGDTGQNEVCAKSPAVEIL